MADAKSSSKGLKGNNIKSFNIGLNLPLKGTTKREQEENRKKLDKEETAKVYEDFVASFEGSGKQLKHWVKGDIVNADKAVKEKSRKDEIKIYKPTSKLAELVNEFSSVKAQKREEKHVVKPSVKKDRDKRKSNLEMFKEELQKMQEEREERHRLKRYINEVEEPPGRKSRFEPPDPAPLEKALALAAAFDEKSITDYENDKTTTNLYLGNINPNMMEEQLCELFGRYGPLASVKIMWPRSDDERARGKNCGFVAFMNRQDGERALDALKGKDITGFEMKMGWGKPVPIPMHPVYVPPSLIKANRPPPPSGLPFNAQPQSQPGRGRQMDKSYGAIAPPGGLNDNVEDSNETIANAIVKVVIPTERGLLAIIHRMVEFVVREGPMFEAMIMNRELNNPMFRFLFENQSPSHIYYRWKLFSILQGDLPTHWPMYEFQMFKGGSIWEPPVMNPYTRGMQDNERDDQRKDEAPKRGQLTDSQRDKLEDMLRELTPQRMKIGEVMVWCLDHAESADEIVECIAESLSILQTPIPKKIARLFLVSDILHNCGAKVRNASFFRKFFESSLPDIFKNMREAHENIEGRLKAEQFKQKVMTCFRAWEDWALYPNDYLIKLQNIFLGLVAVKTDDSSGDEADDIDGAPIDLDGMPLDSADRNKRDPDDVDGVPLDDIDGMPLREESEKEIKIEPIMVIQPAFKPSKWETVDPEEIEAQAMTTSKWESLEPRDDDDIDGRPMEDDSQTRLSSSQTSTGLTDEDMAPFRPTPEEKRMKLREIELKVMKYQDELEAGKRSRKMQLSIAEQVETYRQKLLVKDKEREDERIREKVLEKRREEEQKKVKEWERAREKQKAREKSEKKRRSKDRDRSSSSENSPYRDPRDRRRRDDVVDSAKKQKYRSRSRTPKKSKHSNSRSRSRSPNRKHKHKKSKR